jgi:hypothetical protein
LAATNLEARVTGFFVECDHLRDWLKGDWRALGGVTKSEIEACWKLSDPLQWCHAVCNTHKHSRRLGGGGRPALANEKTAWVREVEISPAKVTIELNWASANPTPIDALKLAEQCVQSWTDFFVYFNISER